MAILTWPSSSSSASQIITPVQYPVAFDDAVTMNSTLNVAGVVSVAQEINVAGNSSCVSVADNRAGTGAIKSNVFEGYLSDATTGDKVILQLGKSATQFASLISETQGSTQNVLIQPDQSDDTTYLEISSSGTFGNVVSGVSKFKVSSAGAITMTEDVGGTGGATSPAIAAYTNGSWTPTFTQTQGTSITSQIVETAYWFRLGNLIVFSMSFRLTQATVSAAETQKFNFNVPVNSNFDGTGYGSGTVSIEPDYGAWVTGNWDTYMRSTPTANTMLFELYVPSAIAAGSLRFSAFGSYEVVD